MISKLTKKEKTSIRYYSDEAKGWLARHTHKGQVGLYDLEMQYLFKNKSVGRVLEIGCGPGEDAINLIKHYGINNYIGIDPAKGFLEIARKNNEKAKFIQKNLYELSDSEGNFDVIWACAVLIHVPKSRLNEALSIIKTRLKPDGIMFISVMEGDQDMQENRPGRYYSLWSEPEFTAVLSQAKLKILSHRKILFENPHNSPWLTYLVKASD